LGGGVAFKSQLFHRPIHRQHKEKNRYLATIADHLNKLKEKEKACV
jgi:hypothetical protein